MDKHLDDAGRFVTREHPEDQLLARAHEADGLSDLFDLCVWIVDEVGYREVAQVIRERREQVGDRLARESGETT